MNKFCKMTTLLNPVAMSAALMAIAPLGLAQDFPITSIFSMGVGSEYHGGAAELIVPDTDTTTPAYGNNSRLRRYELHLAKMFEVTIWECRGSREGFMFWEYKAGNGSIDMGVFEITCALADDIRQAYGLGRAESTTITRPGPRLTGRVTNTVSVPILKIEGNKIDKWLDFVEGFRSIR
jgi:serine/threonine-protein kinase